MIYATRSRSTRCSTPTATRDSAHIQTRLALLCTYLGHVNPGSTYWYLQAAPELLALAAGRLERVEDGAR